MTTVTTPRETSELRAIELGTRLGRKFDATDVANNPWLRQVATAFADASTEDFGFMADMSWRVRGGRTLSDGQVKGVLNVMLAQRRMNAAKAAPATAPTGAASAASIPDGRYRVTLEDGSSLALRFESKNAWVQEKFGEGTRKISLRTGGSAAGEREWTGVGTASAAGQVKLWKSAGPRVAQAMQVLTDGQVEDAWLVAGLAFAQEGSHCFICGLPLDTPESLLVGYGPTCAANNGLPWGDKAQPASVVLARSASQGTAPAGEGLTTQPEQIELPVAAPVKPAVPSAGLSLIDLARQIEQAAGIASPQQGEDEYAF